MQTMTEVLALILMGVYFLFVSYAVYKLYNLYNKNKRKLKHWEDL